MKLTGRSVMGPLWGLVLVAFLIAPVVNGAEKAEPEKTVTKDMTISGTVIEVKNAQGKVTHASIQTEGGAFVVSKKGKGKELMKLVNKRVEATGTLKEKNGKKRFMVTEYRVLE